MVLAFWLAHVVRFSATQWWDIVPIDEFAHFRWMLFILMPFGPILLELNGFYNHPLQKSVWRSLSEMAKAGLWLALLVAGCSIFFRLSLDSRAVVLLFILFAMAALLIRERLTFYQIQARARTGRYREPVLLAGTPEDMHALRDTFSPLLKLEMEIVGEINIETQPISELVELLHRHSVSRVIFAAGHTHMNRLQEAIGACEIEGVEAWMLADFIKTSIAKPTFDVIGSRPMLVFRTTPEVCWALLVKNVFDRLAALVIICFALPFFIFAYIGIRLSSPGPVIFRQQRGGRHGRPFTMFKFRTMRTDAEALRAKLAEQNEMSGPVFKVQNDPRIFPFGRWLRKTSIDELPQLFNVLQGSMSLVGPRPLPLYEVENFESSAQRRRLSVKPGLTCLWQISGRNNVKSFEDWVKLDLEYIDNWSLWLDFKILLKTVPTVLFGLGAR